MYENDHFEWPSFGSFPFKNKYLRIYHGKSNKQHSDIPSIAVFSLLKELDLIEKHSSGYDNFRQQALEEVKKWNEALPKEMEIPKNMISASLNKYYWGQSKYNNMLGLKITVNWKKFFDFLKERSEDRKNIWKTFGYIYNCRELFTQRSLEDQDKFKVQMEKYTGQVRQTASTHINLINTSLSELETTTKNAISKIYKTVIKIAKRDKKEPAYMLYTLIYFNELRLKYKTLRSLTQIGDFSACFSEMRRIIEGLTTHMFWDQLELKILKVDQRAKDIPLLLWFNEGAFKEANELGLNIKEVSNKKQILGNEVLKSLLKESDLNSDNTKIFIEKLHINMSIASFTIIYGKRCSISPLSKYNEKHLNDSKLMITMPDVEFLKIGSQEIVDALTVARIIDSQSSMDIQDRIYNTLKEEKLIIIPPPPTFPLRILGRSILSKETISELKDMYNEFSPFTHSAWESNTVWPFTSVLEIMTFANNMKRFTESMDNAINDFISFFKTTLNVFLI
ncbi:MAG: hypothetical protein AMDU4_FER2C00123G0007 [Ferroplasma sp. Type II]|jgi:hypothetical protein|uniref:hypothetical protein n=1 Tax=Ferroplasma sp. Type II TaxID=261388 RepID=UPI0003896A47|nr:hypothetical protein [Ferroplasma sp. Type II]EQB72898.1 MAG: hypothetical protein AMDU4_FER2C00123G0007 [Ferroplasma sp. Type II]